MNLIANNQTRSRDQRWRSAEASGSAKHRALVRLYERRSAVDNLIHALERYQQEQGVASRNSVLEFTVLEKLS